MKIVLLAVAVAFVSLLPQCNTIENTIYLERDKTPAISTKLVGDWTVKADIEMQTSEAPVFRIARSDQPDELRLSIVPSPSNFPKHVVFRVIEIKGKLFIDATVEDYPSWGHHVLSLGVKGKSQIEIRHLLVDRARDADGPRLASTTKQLYVDPKIGGVQIPIPLNWTDGGVTITATTEELREFLSGNLDDSWFGPCLTMSKVDP